MILVSQLFEVILVASFLSGLAEPMPGIRRRGLTVEALRQFMLLQGPSQAIVSLEWDSIWALNKKVIDPVAPRHWAILEEKMLVRCAEYTDALD